MFTWKYRSVQGRKVRSVCSTECSVQCAVCSVCIVQCSIQFLVCRVQQSVPITLKCYDKTSTTHFLVPFGPIFKIFFWNFFLTFFSTLGNFLTKSDPPYGENFEKFSKCSVQIKRFWTLNATQKPQPSRKHRSWENQEKLAKNSQTCIFC